MSDQVVRYDNEQQYLDFKNQEASLSRGTVMNLPSWEDDPDAYWEAFYSHKRAHPEQMFSWQTVLLGEEIVNGVLERQHVKLNTLMFENTAAYRANREYIKVARLPDPCMPVSAKFDRKQDAERMRSLLLQGEPGYYYGIRHFTQVSMFTRQGAQ
jgi:hypothetical protein